ncbi:MAG: nucleotide sugar dehydrogenase [Candidatus Omnitrophica bacterium]|nr:nucleotide sugar dehydrogenase [Candidatus Omnitrophota bacterium]
MKELKQKILSKKAKIGVIGLGYVGLPLAVSFARVGFTVLGLDKNKARVSRVKGGRNYNEDVSVKEISGLVRKKKFIVSSDLSLLSKVDVIFICVPTPLKRKYTPDISYILSSVKTIQFYIKKGTLVILESTTYPGTTEELILPKLEKGGFKVGKDFYLAFSPERIDPGNKKYPVTKIPKIVGGVDKASGILSKMLYQTIIKSVHLVSSPKAAEMVKLLENSFRLVNISWVNEVAMMCHKMNVDIWEVIDGAKTKPFGFMPFYPSLGVGGHCIPDDPLYLYWKAKHHGVSSKFIKLSADTNDKVPEYVLNRMKVFLKENKRPSMKSKILVVGVTYKKDVKDLRRSPAIKFLELLKKEEYKVSYSDPLIPYLEIGSLHLKSEYLSEKILKLADCVIIATEHTGVDYKKIKTHANLIFDLCNVYKGKRNSKLMIL